VSVVDGHLMVQCKHESRDDKHGSVARQLSRSYKLPENVDVTSIKSHLDSHGVLHVSGTRNSDCAICGVGGGIATATS